MGRQPRHVVVGRSEQGPGCGVFFIYGMYFYAADSGTVWCIRFVHRLIPVYSLTRVLLYMGGGRGGGSNSIYRQDPDVKPHRKSKPRIKLGWLRYK